MDWKSAFYYTHLYTCVHVLTKIEAPVCRSTSIALKTVQSCFKVVSLILSFLREHTLCSTLTRLPTLERSGRVSSLLCSNLLDS